MTTKKVQPTYELSGISISAYTVPKEQMDAVSEVAKALGENAKALGKLARAFKPPHRVVLETGIRIGQ